MKYDVYLYPVVQVKVSIEAESHEQAIALAEETCDLHALLDHGEFEWAEEIAYWLVDEEGDEQYERSAWYEWRDGRLQDMDNRKKGGA